MKVPGFLVLDGIYDEEAFGGFLFVRPMGTDALFTVGAIVSGDDEINAIIGKVILAHYINDSYINMRPATVAQKSFHLCDPLDGKRLRGSESTIVLTGQFLEKVIRDDGDVSYIIDTIFLLKGHFDFYVKEPEKKGEWLELEMQMQVLFDEVLSVEEWIRLNPDQT